MEKIPDEGAALIVYYHGAIPIDYYYFLAKVIIQKGRIVHSVADYFLFKVPGFKLLLEVFSVIHGPQEECVKALKSGHLLGISPGGVREALLSDETYPLLWGKRKGFAQVAIDSKVVHIGFCLPSLFSQDVSQMAPYSLYSALLLPGRVEVLLSSWPLTEIKSNAALVLSTVGSFFSTWSECSSSSSRFSGAASQWMAFFLINFVPFKRESIGATLSFSFF
ncbi:transmembrane protein 68-like [Salvelinus fontinalis]|uniref:transmembrane protein 68-like n=1 Tax=Salvelinus fontinalis TaxID=8038 RepID=UPI00248686FD|nr:transmembrane protein 68-like [Salvelinus fontinalis]